MSRPYTEADKRYFKWVAEFPCLFCQIEPCEVAHHVRYRTDGGIGIKPSSHYVINVCPKCHDAIHKVEGEMPFYKKRGYTIDQIHEHAGHLWEMYNG